MVAGEGPEVEVEGAVAEGGRRLTVGVAGLTVEGSGEGLEGGVISVAMILLFLGIQN